MGADADARLVVGSEDASSVLARDHAGLEIDLGGPRGLETEVGRLESMTRPLRLRRIRRGEYETERSQRRGRSLQRPTLGGVFASARSATNPSMSRVASGESNITRWPS